ncbi:MAG: TIR domain-containing protein [Clostridia bacterium]|nr:TIR domain-containing protein [Clostridia bacterium]
MSSVGGIKELRYKTRGDTLPHHKPRVYFTCHPSDFEQYFEETKNYIIRRRNCVVWYKPHPAAVFADEEQMEELLSQMQLFVVPVTGALLQENNDDLFQEIAYARRKNIPILPLMEEEGLDDLFNERFGALQYYAPHRKDIAAVSFEEKLGKYLDRILATDEDAERIRNIFAARIFLSYRKKDRKKARELMRLIHKNPFCQNIAIWYDEYLLPGFEFDRAIEKELINSDLFVLAVTPNLVEKNNYVIRVEYPKAKEMGKPVLPVELEKTNGDELRTNFPEIPDCVDVNNEEQMTLMLRESLRSIVMQEDEHDSEYNFLLGLAYLYGIEVEVDHEHAVQLIEEAARMDLPEAVEQMANMYMEGLGVVSDTEQALYWSERAIEVLRNVPDRNRYYDAVEKCAQIYKESGKPRDAFATWGLVSDELFELENKEVEERLRLFRMMAEASELSQEMADNEDALQYGEYAIHCITDEEGRIVMYEGVLPFMVNYYIWQAMLYADKGSYDRAEDYFDNARNLMKAVDKIEGADADTLREMQMLLWYHVGLMENLRNKNDEAKAAFLKGYDLCLELVEEGKSMKARSYLANFLFYFGLIAYENDDEEDARLFCERALEASERMQKRTISVQVVLLRCRVYTLLIQMEKRTAGIRAAREWRAYQLDEVQRLESATDSHEVYMALISGGIACARIERLAGNNERAIEEFRNIIDEMQEQLQDEKRQVLAFLRAFCIANLELADIHLLDERPQMALECYLNALPKAEMLRKDRKQNEICLDSQYRLTHGIALAKQAMGQLEEAEKLFLECIGRIEEKGGKKIWDENSELCHLYVNLGDIALMQRDLEKAGILFEKAHQYAGQIFRPTIGTEAKRLVNLTEERLARLAHAQGDFDKARKHYARCEELTMDEMEGTENYYKAIDVAKMMYQQAELELSCGNRTKANEHLDKMHEWVQKELLLKEDNTAEEQQLLAMVFIGKGKVWLEDDAHRAEQYLSHSAYILNKLRSDDKNHEDSLSFLHLLVQTSVLLSASYIKLDDIDHLRECVKENEKWARKLFDEHSGVEVRCLYPALLGNASLLEMFYDDEWAMDHLQIAAEALEESCPGRVATSIYQQMFVAWRILAEIRTVENREDDAFFCTIQACNAAEHVWPDDIDDEERLSMAKEYGFAGDGWYERGEMESADDMYARCYALLWPLLGKTDDFEVQDLYVDYLMFCGIRAEQQGNEQEAHMYTQTVISICKRLILLTDDPKEKERLDKLCRLLRGEE